MQAGLIVRDCLETEADEKMNGSKVVESIDSSGADYETETEPDTALPYVSAFSNSAIPTPVAESLRQAPQVRHGRT